MTRGVSKIVASMLGSNDRFSVDEGRVWLPDMDSYAFTMRDHITKALELHGYTASAATRSHTGIVIDVPEAQSIDESEARSTHTEGYGYTGRVAGIKARGQMFEVNIGEPGSILQVPETGWTDGKERVVIGGCSGLSLAEVNTDNVETYENKDTVRVKRGERPEEEMSLSELANSGSIIVYKGEWTGYPQERF